MTFKNVIAKEELRHPQISERQKIGLAYDETYRIFSNLIRALFTVSEG